MCIEMYRTSRNKILLLFIAIILLYSCVNEYNHMYLTYVEECHKISNIVFIKTHKVKLVL